MPGLGVLVPHLGYDFGGGRSRGGLDQSGASLARERRPDEKKGLFTTASDKDSVSLTNLCPPLDSLTCCHKVDL